MQFKHVPIVLSGVDTKTDEKNSLIGALKYAKNMFMQKTKKWRSRYGTSTFGVGYVNPYTNSRVNMLVNNAEQSQYLSDSAIGTLGNVSNNSVLANTPMWGTDKFINVSPMAGVQFINAADNFVSFSKDGVTSYVWVNGEFGYNHSAGYTVSASYIVSGVYTACPHSTDYFNYAFNCKTDGTKITRFGITGALTKTNAITVGTHAKTAAVGSAGTSFCLVAYNRGTNLYGWIWDAVNDTIVSEFTIQTGQYNADSWGIAGCLVGSNQASAAKFHVAVPHASTAYRYNIYSVTTAGVVTLVTTQDLNSKIVQDHLQLTSAIMVPRESFAFPSANPQVWYSGKTTGFTNIRNASFVDATLLVDKLIVSQATFAFQDGGFPRPMVVLSSSGANVNSANDAQTLWNAAQGQIMGLVSGYPLSRVKSGLWHRTVLPTEAPELGVPVMGESNGVIILNKQVLPNAAFWNNEVFTDAGGNISLIETSSNLCMTAGFFAPPNPIVSATSGSVGLLTAGTYNIFLTWTTKDNLGKIYYSPASEIITCTLTTGTSIQLLWYQSVTNVYPGERHDVTTGYDLCVWMSKDNSIYQLQAAINGASLGAEAGYTLVTYITTVDATTGIGAAYPFQGGVLESGAIPPVKGLSSGLGRMWAYITNTTDTWMFSTKLSPTFGPRFPAGFRLKVNTVHGRPVTAAEMDNKLVLFHEYGIYATWGEGPDETGVGSFSQPQLISQGVGCKYARSVVLTDAGLMFMSHEGIYLVDRGMSIQYIGAPVEDYNNLTITSALNLTDVHQVRFYSLEGTTLVYDEYHKIWSIFSTQDTTAAAIIDGVPTFHKVSTQKFLKEDKTVYTDNATPFDCELQTQWMNLAEVQGYQRLRKLTWSGATSNNATLKLYRDWGSTEFETFTIPSSVTPYQFQVKPKIQKGEAMRFDLTYSSITALVEIDAFAVEAGFNEGTFRTNPSTQRVKGA